MDPSKPKSWVGSGRRAGTPRRFMAAALCQKGHPGRARQTPGRRYAEPRLSSLPKALLHAAHAITSARESEHRALLSARRTLMSPNCAAGRMASSPNWPEHRSCWRRLRGVQVLAGRGYFEDSKKRCGSKPSKASSFISFDHAIIAVGSNISECPKLLIWAIHA